jgi:hypothetical protein
MNSEGAQVNSNALQNMSAVPLALHDRWILKAQQNGARYSRVH